MKKFISKIFVGTALFLGGTLQAMDEPSLSQIVDHMQEQMIKFKGEYGRDFHKKNGEVQIYDEKLFNADQYTVAIAHLINDCVRSHMGKEETMTPQNVKAAYTKDTEKNSNLPETYKASVIFPILIENYHYVVKCDIVDPSFYHYYSGKSWENVKIAQAALNKAGHSDGIFRFSGNKPEVHFCPVFFTKIIPNGDNYIRMTFSSSAPGKTMYETLKLEWNNPGYYKLGEYVKFPYLMGLGESILQSIKLTHGDIGNSNNVLFEENIISYIDFETAGDASDLNDVHGDVYCSLYNFGLSCGWRVPERNFGNYNKGNVKNLIESKLEKEYAGLYSFIEGYKSNCKEPLFYLLHFEQDIFAQWYEERIQKIIKLVKTYKDKEFFSDIFIKLDETVEKVYDLFCPFLQRDSDDKEVNFGVEYLYDDVLHTCIRIGGEIKTAKSIFEAGDFGKNYCWERYTASKLRSMQTIASLNFEEDMVL